MKQRQPPRGREHEGPGAEDREVRPTSEPGYGGRAEVGDPTREDDCGPRHRGDHEGRGRGEARGSEWDRGKPEVERLNPDHRVMIVTEVTRPGLSVVTGSPDEAVLVTESVLVIKENRGGVL